MLLENFIGVDEAENYPDIKQIVCAKNNDVVRILFFLVDQVLSDRLLFGVSGVFFFS